MQFIYFVILSLFKSRRQKEDKLLLLLLRLYAAQSCESFVSTLEKVEKVMSRSLHPASVTDPEGITARVRSSCTPALATVCVLQPAIVL